MASACQVSKAKAEDVGRKCDNLIQPMLHEVNTARFMPMFRQERSSTGARVSAAASGAGNGIAAGFLSGAQLHRVPAKQDKQRLDSIVATRRSTGEPYSKQRFVFDDNNLPIRRINSLWEPVSSKYVDVEEYEFTWDSDGYCLSQVSKSNAYGYGVKIDYTYNDRKLGTSMIQSNMEPDGSWTPYSKGEYGYDDRGNIVEEYTYLYDEETKEWTPQAHNLASWDANGWQTMIEPYYWNGTEWVGNGERQEYTYLAKDLMTQVKSYYWLPDAKEWLWYCNLENDFNERNQLLRREKTFYNREYNDWGGEATYNGTTYYNEKGLKEYYDDGRNKYDLSYASKEHGKYVKGSDWTYDWTDTDNGGRSAYQVASIYDDDGNQTVTGVFVDGYDASGNHVYLLEKTRDWTSGEMVPDYERDWTYDDNGLLVGEHTYTYADNGTKRHGDLSVEYTYADNGKLLSIVNSAEKSESEGGGLTPMGAKAHVDAGGIDWVYTSKNEFTYEQDTVLVANVFYRWVNDEWTTSSGEHDYYDYATPLSDVVIWPGYTGWHKMDRMETFISGSDDDWYVYDYYYSNVGATGIKAAGKHGAVRVYPTLVEDGFTVEAPADAEVLLFGANGMCVARTKVGYVQMQNMPKGMYVVSVAGDKTKIIKK